MPYRTAQPNFSKGVLTKELWGRSDIAPYNAAVRQGTNVVVLKYGGLQKRPGTRLVYEIKDGKQRMIPFEGAFEASYALLLGQATMRLASLGGMVIEEKLTIEAIVRSNPIVVQVSYHGLITGDEWFFSGLQGSTQLNGLILPVTVIDANHFSVPVNGATISALTGDTGGITRIGAPPAPPTPPVVPPPDVTPDPPPTGGGGLGSGDGGVGGGSPVGGGHPDRQIP